MPVKSSFFPKEALQGQDLPSHVLWSEIEFDLIRIAHSKNIAFKEAYNVSSDDIKIEECLVTIKRVEVNGYLGIVFSSKILSEKMVDEKVTFSFVLEDNVVESLPFSVHLFRPEIIIGKPPDEMLVDPASGEVTPKILVENLGEGTAIVDIETTDESELKKAHPEFVENFVKEFIERVKYGMAKLKNDFRKYTSLLDQIEEYLTRPVKFEEESLRTFEKFEEEFSSAVEENDEFGGALAEMLVEIIIRNMEFSNVYKFVLDYMNSIGQEKILIRDPFNVVKLSPEPAELHVRIKCIDLLKQMCNTIDLDPISISGKQKGEIALFKLFQWGKKKE